jgi:acetylornithine/N-succinyldiaminopimelate aminotransferase
MATNRELYEAAQKAFVPNYRQAPFILARGQGCRVWDVEGSEFLDFSGGIAVLSVGHAHPTLAKAIAEQAATLIHTSNLFFSDRAIELATELTKRTGFDRVYFANSGTEANEALIKLARRWHWQRGDEQRTELVATHHSFHGRTMGAVALTGQPKYHQGFGAMLPGISHVDYGDLDALRAAVGPRTAAVFLEPIQAEGGIIVASDEYLRGARAICDEAGALLIFDEVQTGYGRTGRFLAREHSGVMPDACSLAKGIGGGFPLAAIAITEKLAPALTVGTHGSTFGGNPLAAAAGLAVLRIFDEEGLVANAEIMGRYLGEKLAALVADPSLPAAAEHRGKGLLQGVRVDGAYDPMGTLVGLREQHQVLASLAGGDVIRLAPPLNVTAAEVDLAVGALAQALRDAPLKADAPAKK